MNTASSSTETPPPPIPLPDLITSLEQATFMAKQLPITTDPNHLMQIYSSLHHTHNVLSSFLSITQFPPFPHATAAENSVSSATAENGEEEPMQLGDDEEEPEAEDNTKTSIDRVEERMRDVFIKNKRPKRLLSPSSAAIREEERKGCEDRYVVGMKILDPQETKSRGLELVYQFHG